MHLSKYFLPLLKENPAEAKIASHRLMLKAGMIRQQNSGIYHWLPLGIKTLKKISSIVSKNLNKFGCQEILMPCIQPAELWQESGRYDSYGKEMLRIKDRHDNEMLFGPTNEEAVTDIFRKNIFSYKELPKNLYHIQWKFRDEIRPRFGIMRGREFLMKDGYSFDIDQQSAEQTYQNMYLCYLNIFSDLGITAIPVIADTGVIGGNLSHEFHVIAQTGESQIYFDKKYLDLVKNKNITFSELASLYSAADEMHKPETCPINDDHLISGRGIEVGHIFCFGDKYTKSMNAKISDKNGNQIYPFCGSYGIGISRLVAAIIESSHDDNGIIWPSQVSPFDISLINLATHQLECKDLADRLYNELIEANYEVLYDDTDDSAGAKFAKHDLLGFTWQITVGPKLAKQNLVEIKNRKSGEKYEIESKKILSIIGKI